MNNKLTKLYKELGVEEAPPDHPIYSIGSIVTSINPSSIRSSQNTSDDADTQKSGESPEPVKKHKKEK